MPEPTLVLHAGPHKTGSTALQLRLLKATPYLAHHGYAYPELGVFQFGHHHLVSFLRGNTEDAGGVTEASLTELAAAPTNLVLSSEDLVYVTPEQFEPLKRIFAGWRIEVVMFLRSPVELFPSHWQELVKHGRDTTLLEYVSAFLGLSRAVDTAALNAAQQAQRLAQAFGRDRLRLVCYNNILADGIDLFDFFVEKVLGLPPDLPRQTTVPLNMALPPYLVETLRSLNERHLRRHGRKPSSGLTAALLEQRAQIEAEPDFARFRAALEQQARQLTLDSTQDWLKRREARMLYLFADRIENIAAKDRLYSQDYQRSIPYGTAYWAAECGFGDYLDGLLNQLLPA